MRNSQQAQARTWIPLSRYDPALPRYKARGQLLWHEGSASEPGRGGKRRRRKEGNEEKDCRKIPGRSGSLMPGNGQGGWRGRPKRPRVSGAAAKPRARGRGRSSSRQGPASVPHPRPCPTSAPPARLSPPRPGPTCFRYSPAPALGAALSPPLFPARPPARGRPSPRYPPWARSPRSARRFLPRAPPAFTSFPQPAPRRRKAPWETPAPPGPALAPRPRRGQSTARPGPATPIPPRAPGAGPGTGPVTDPRHRAPARPLAPPEKRFCCPVSQALFPSAPAPWRRPPASRPKMAPA